jgi:hypothetical protein
MQEAGVYWEGLQTRVVNGFVHLRTREKKNVRMQLIKGEVPESLVEMTEEMRKTHDSLAVLAASLGDFLNKVRVTAM